MYCCNSDSQVIKGLICGPLTSDYQTYLDIKFISLYMVIELREFNKKEKKKTWMKVIILAKISVLKKYLAYSLVSTCVVL